MKKWCFISLGILAIFSLLLSCSDGRKAEREQEDSIRIADSIAQEETAKAAAEQAAEQARLDSIRQDSIAQEEKLNLAQKSFIENTSWLKTLPKFGFELKSKKTTEDWDEWEGTERVLETRYVYQRDLNGRIVTFEFSLMKYKEGGLEIGNGYDATMYIKDSQEMETFLSDIKKLGKAKGPYLYVGEGIWVSREGNHINFSGEH